MKSKLICDQLAKEIGGAFSALGPHSGFSGEGIASIADSLEKLVVAIKNEIVDTTKNIEQFNQETTSQKRRTLVQVGRRSTDI